MSFSLAIVTLVARSVAAITSITTISDFEHLRATQGFALLVYAPWCGHSRALLPEFEHAASLKPQHLFAQTDGTVADELATELDVKGYPTLLFIHRGDGPPATYHGERHASAIAEWAAAMLQPAVPRLSTSAEVSTWITGKHVPLVLFVDDYAAAASEVEALVATAATTPAACAGRTRGPP